MISSAMIFLIFTLIVHNISGSHGSLYDIIKIDEVTYGPQMTPKQMFQFISSGVPQIFWLFIDSDDFSKVNFLKTNCKKSLLTLVDGLKNNDETAYKFIDSSGKTPTSFMRSTITSFGDYDECISIKDTLNNLVGKYCAFDIFANHAANVSKSGTNTIGNSTFLLTQVPVFKGVPFIHSICLPSQCSQIEIRQMLSTGKAHF